MCVRARRGQGGQALLEFLFLAFIAAVVAVGFVYKFNLGFRNYLNGWFKPDGYLFCLIENGDLPGQSDQCSPPQFQFQPDLKALGGAVGGSAGKTASTSAGGGGGGVGGRIASERGRNSLIPATSRDQRGITLAAGDKGKSGAKGESTGSDGFSTAPGTASSGLEGRTGTAGERGRYAPYEDKSVGQAKGKSTQTVPTTDRDLKTAREIATEKAKKRRQLEDQEDLDFSIGNIFRYLIIAILIFVILFFAGSQAVSMSRGSRRRR